MIDLSKIKPGDEVTVKATVVCTGTDYRGLPYVTYKCPLKDPDSDSPIGAALLSNVTDHHPKALSVGDRVKTSKPVDQGEIVAIDSAWAWVRWDHEGLSTEELSRLERV